MTICIKDTLMLVITDLKKKLYINKSSKQTSISRIISFPFLYCMIIRPAYYVSPLNSVCTFKSTSICSLSSAYCWSSHGDNRSRREAKRHPSSLAKLPTSPQVIPRHSQAAEDALQWFVGLPWRFLPVGQAQKTSRGRPWRSILIICLIYLSILLWCQSTSLYLELLDDRAPHLTSKAGPSHHMEETHSRHPGFEWVEK